MYSRSISGKRIRHVDDQASSLDLLPGKLGTFVETSRRARGVAEVVVDLVGGTKELQVNVGGDEPFLEALDGESAHNGDVPRSMRDGDKSSPEREAFDIVGEAVFSTAPKNTLSLFAMAAIAGDPTVTPSLDGNDANLFVMFSKAA